MNWLLGCLAAYFLELIGAGPAAHKHNRCQLDLLYGETAQRAICGVCPGAVLGGFSSLDLDRLGDEKSASRHSCDDTWRCAATYTVYQHTAAAGLKLAALSLALQAFCVLFQA